MKIVVYTAWFLMLLARSPSPFGVPADEVHSSQKGVGPAVLGLDTIHGSIADLRVSMTREQLVATGHPIIERSVMQEGDEYIVIEVLLHKDLVIECWFDGGGIERLRTTAKGISDERGISVGSTLAMLKTSYPGGRLITGNEDGRRYANFINNSRVVFEMELGALPQACFSEEHLECEAPPELRVRGITVHAGPAG
ncbi:hypothetical protein [Xanthomonas melonis]|uniref:hypothetical protein n=1 Tax=Xanthomonas melonis TaxID=56456 RepID=UPI0011B0329F|nr:hypothetical protein [Xanthomonas melonis]MCC4601678.1 hypothetical protein [Xanthomonas melonis]